MHVVCAWLGNSESVARKHYLQVTEEHFEAAQTADGSKDEQTQKQRQTTGKTSSNELLRRSVEAAQNAAQSVIDSRDSDGQRSAENAKTSDNSHVVTLRQPLTMLKTSPGGTRTPDQGIMSPLL
jgi:hypothetical protein